MIRASRLRITRQQASLDRMGEGSQTGLDERNIEARIFGGPAEGDVADVSLPGPEEYLHRAVSAGAADGGRAVPRGAAAEHQSGDGRIAVHFVQFVRAGLSGKSDRGGLAARRRHAAQGADYIYVRHFAVHVLRTVRGRLPDGLPGADAGFRDGQLQPGRGDLGPSPAGSGAHANALHPIEVRIRVLSHKAMRLTCVLPFPRPRYKMAAPKNLPGVFFNVTNGTS